MSKWERRLGKRIYGLTLSYSEHLIWNVLYPKFFADCPREKAVEIGSAPGQHLVDLHRRFGLDVYGIEYSPEGAAVNRDVFAAAGIDSSHVVQADFFSREFLDSGTGRFDVVISRGFIEHFTDMDAVLRAHLEILRPGGLLVVSIPNLRGLNYWLSRSFHFESLALHNLDIMKFSVFRNLFEGRGLEPLFCGPFGILDFGLFNTRLPGRQRFLNICRKFQRLLNVSFRLLGRPGWWEGRWTSPYLLYAGRKQ